MRWGRESGFTCIQVETVADLPTTVLEITASSSLAKELPSCVFVLVGLFSRQKREELAQKVAEERSRREEEARQLEAELAREREEQLRRQEEERAQREREEMERIRKQVAGPARAGKQVGCAALAQDGARGQLRCAEQGV